jgi:DNA polymerase III delta subunit
MLLSTSLVQMDPEKPGVWMTLLSSDLNQWKQNPSQEATQALLKLYEKATLSINKELYKKDDDYFKIWMGYAKLLG